MKLKRGVSYEVPGGTAWRKHSIEIDSTDYPEAAHLDQERLAEYLGWRAEAILLRFQYADGRFIGHDETYEAHRKNLSDFAAHCLEPF